MDASTPASAGQLRRSFERRSMPERFDPYHTWLGISPLDQPANHYRLLGISLFEDAADVIDNAADRQMAHLRGFQSGAHQQLSQHLLNEVAAARLCLLKPATKAAYDAKLRAELLAQPSTVVQPLPPKEPSARRNTAEVVPLRRASRTADAQGSAGLARPPDAATDAAMPVTAAPAADVWESLLGDTTPTTKIGGTSAIGKTRATGKLLPTAKHSPDANHWPTGKPSIAKRAAEKQRKILFVAVPVMALALIGAVAIALVSSDRNSSDSGPVGAARARSQPPGRSRRRRGLRTIRKLRCLSAAPRQTSSHRRRASLRW